MVPSQSGYVSFVKPIWCVSHQACWSEHARALKWSLRIPFSTPFCRNLRFLQFLQKFYPYLVLQYIAAQGKGKIAEILGFCNFCRKFIFLQKFYPYLVLQYIAAQGKVKFLQKFYISAESIPKGTRKGLLFCYTKNARKSASPVVKQVITSLFYSMGAGVCLKLKIEDLDFN